MRGSNHLGTVLKQDRRQSFITATAGKISFLLLCTFGNALSLLVTYSSLIAYSNMLENEVQRTAKFYPGMAVDVEGKLSTRCLR